jgi:thiol-disulfide isomerase/thioredoxin
MANKKSKRPTYQAPKQSAAKAQSKPKATAAAVPERPSQRTQGRGGTASWWILGGAIVAIVVGVIVLSATLGEEQTGETNAASWELPALGADNDPNGDGRINLADFEGKPLVVNFFASWCTSCDRELPVFRQAIDDFGDDVQIIFVNSNETGNWRPMAERGGIDDQILVDDIGGANNNGLYRSLGGTGGMPITAFYDADGNLFDVTLGEFDANRLLRRRHVGARCLTPRLPARKGWCAEMGPCSTTTRWCGSTVCSCEPPTPSYQS